MNDLIPVTRGTIILMNYDLRKKPQLSRGTKRKKYGIMDDLKMMARKKPPLKKYSMNDR